LPSLTRSRVGVGDVVAGSTSIEFVNYPAWRAAINDALDQWVHQSEDNAHDLGKLAVTEGRTRAPVRTGRLRRGIDYEVHEGENGWELRFFNEVPYAVFQEFGTRHVPAHPHMRPGMAAAVNQYTRLMLRGMK